MPRTSARTRTSVVTASTRNTAPHEFVGVQHLLDPRKPDLLH